MFAFAIKTFIGFIIFIFIFSSTGIKTTIKTVSLINAGHYMALPESMAWQCVDTIKRQHAKRIKLAQAINVDPAIKRQMIAFEQASYEKDLRRLCGIADLSELPDRKTLMEIKP